MIDVQKKMEQLAEKASKASLAKAKKSENIQLPICSNNISVVPNSVLRSALFGIIKKGRRAYLERKEIASVAGITIIFSGPRLDQADLDVWEQCICIARTEELGNKIYFSAYCFLKSIKRSTGKSNHEWLKGAFARLSTSVVEITDNKKTYFGPMILGGARDEQTGKYFIEINPKIMELYGKTGWTGIEFEQRLALKSQPMAQWLHGFYSTHAKPYPYKVSTLRELCGSETKELFNFRTQLKKSFTQVSKITRWKFWIDDKDLLHVEKKHGIAPRVARHSTKGGTA